MPDYYEPDEIVVGESVMHADLFTLKFTKEGRITHVFALDWKAVNFLHYALTDLKTTYNK